MKGMNVVNCNSSDIFNQHFDCDLVFKYKIKGNNQVMARYLLVYETVAFKIIIPSTWMY